MSTPYTRLDKNNAAVLLSLDGKLKIRPTLSAAGSTHAVVDVVGYFAR